MSEIWGITSPTNGTKPTYFRQFRNLTAISTAYVFRTKYDIHNWASALEATKDLLRRLKMSWTLVHKQLKIGPEFKPTLREFCILLHCHASHMGGQQNEKTELNQTLPNGGQ